MLTELERRVILGLQRDVEIAPRPFMELARQVGVSEEKFLAAVQSLQKKGYIRRFGATLRHQLSGFGANAMVTWQVPAARLTEVGEMFARHRAVTHCYARDPAPGWPYNLYTMLHAKTPAEITALADRMAAEAGLSRFEILFSETELKKTTMRYFREE
ncbi:MAG: Lrp/AsnC family transcriptional regulator [Deltaproteobacteria bacterium]|nr:Lrp/AsnC family transcriptional regulator [Deltaproteobacteria bacterium]